MVTKRAVWPTRSQAKWSTSSEIKNTNEVEQYITRILLGF